jgi:hypothetical protein
MNAAMNAQTACSTGPAEGWHQVLVCVVAAERSKVQIHVVPEMLDRDPVPAGTENSEAVPAGTRTDGTPAGTPDIAHPGRPGRCHLEDGPAISPADAQRIACSATFSAMLHDPGDGSVLDAGRRSRTATFTTPSGSALHNGRNPEAVHRQHTALAA